MGTNKNEQERAPNLPAFSAPEPLVLRLKNVVDDHVTKRNGGSGDENDLPASPASSSSLF